MLNLAPNGICCTGQSCGQMQLWHQPEFSHPPDSFTSQEFEFNIHKIQNIYYII
jgi:hypothetical protein